MSAFSLPISPVIFPNYLHRPTERSATAPINYRHPHLRYTALAPVHFQCRKTYLDKWAVTLSLKDGCFQANLLAVMVFLPPSPLSCNFGTLDSGLGCFPFHHGFSTRSVSAVQLIVSIRSLVRFGKMMNPPSLSSALPLTKYIQRST
jgi:hypothetical protein